MNRLRKRFKHYKIKIFSPNFVLVVLLVIAVFLSGMLATKVLDLKRKQDIKNQQIYSQKQQEVTLQKLQDKVIKEKYVFKIKWGDLGKKMIEDGVIDKTKLAKAVTGKDELPKDLDKYFSNGQNKIELTQSNSQFWVDILWGLGLANKNEILEKGEMVKGGSAANFASTGGWTIGAKQPMDIYSKYQYITLSEKQQKIVEEIAGNIYRPCCGNSTAFPDCNHGMAMLGLIELMVSQNFSKEEIYKTALAFNVYWFPQTYLDIAFHFDKAEQDYSKKSPKELLSKTFSSAMGYQTIREKLGDIKWPALQGGGSCGA
ncbi:MAG: hypothetical protein AAB609_01140 [Patescibacteria group bacterium]